MLSSIPRPTGQMRPPATRIPRVCVVDSKADDYQGWNATADANGFRLQFEVSVEEALRLARTAAVDLWVVNTELPRLSGYELCAMLKARSAHAAVHLVADRYTAEAEQAAWAARATVFRCKTAQSDWLESLLRHLQRQA